MGFVVELIKRTKETHPIPNCDLPRKRNHGARSDQQEHVLAAHRESWPLHESAGSWIGSLLLGIPRLGGVQGICFHFLLQSLRLVYCFIIFRKVPVIRIFGTDADGIKTCMHVHGVFPYLYIPFDDSKGESGDRFTYQVATGLDKAINISLGQAHADVQHVFKIVHVKGM